MIPPLARGVLYRSQISDPGGPPRARDDSARVDRITSEVHIIDHIYYHTDMDIPELVPESGLESGVRAYAKIIDEMNKLDIRALRSSRTN